MKPFLALLVVLSACWKVESDEYASDYASESETYKSSSAKLSFAMSPRCRYVFTKFNQERKYANLLTNQAIESIEKSNGKAVATLLEEHVNNAKTILSKKVSGSSEAVRHKLTDWLLTILKLRDLLLTTKLKGSSLQFEEAICNIARLLIETVLCIYH